MDLHSTPSGGRADTANASLKTTQNSWVTAPALAVELDICQRTLDRWIRDAALGFPQPRYVNKRKYFERSAIEAWKTATAVKAAGER
jgi:predicted DNA-binding transcriptional regulator AlpA